MRRLLTGLLVAVVLAATQAPADAATRYTLSLKTNQAKVPVGANYVLSGQLKPARAGVTVTRLLLQEGAWLPSGTAKTNSQGRWSMRVTAPDLGRRLTWKVRAKIGSKTVSSAPVALDAFAPSPTISVDQRGPWQSILGADVSSFQHGSSGSPIDFAKMYDSGVRFVYIKASDGRDNGHSRAAPWYNADRVSAQAAGIYTGLYHYAYLPDTTDQKTVIADARAQADKFLWRIAATGGLTSQDLNPVLDLEESCVRAVNGKCTARTTPALATLWALTWLERVELTTGRRPLLYSTPSWLEDWTTPASSLRLYPLWIARYGFDPLVVTSPNPLAKTSGGCYQTAWTNSDCSGTWRIWQHTNQADGSQFGVATSTLDLNVIADSNSLATLLAGTWTATDSDLAPVNEATTMSVDAPQLKLTGGTALVRVTRPNAAMVTAGTIAVTVDGAPLVGVIVDRSAAGVWTVQLPAIPVGTQQLQFNFVDVSGVHAANSVAIAMPTA